MQVLAAGDWPRRAQHAAVGLPSHVKGHLYVCREVLKHGCTQEELAVWLACSVDARALASNRNCCNSGPVGPLNSVATAGDHNQFWCSIKCSSPCQSRRRRLWGAIQRWHDVMGHSMLGLQEAGHPEKLGQAPLEVRRRAQ